MLMRHGFRVEVSVLGFDRCPACVLCAEVEHGAAETAAISGADDRRAGFCGIDDRCTRCAYDGSARGADDGNASFTREIFAGCAYDGSARACGIRSGAAFSCIRAAGCACAERGARSAARCFGMGRGWRAEVPRDRAW